MSQRRVVLIGSKYKEGYNIGDGYMTVRRLLFHESKAYFVTRSKDTSNYLRLYSAEVDKSTGVLCDQTISLNNHYATKGYPEKLRRIKFHDEAIGNTFEFVTNNFFLRALDVANIYKHRWAVELFYKWIKQHLKIKSFWGYSDNAVRIQVYTTIIAYVAVDILKEKRKIKHTNYEILQVLSITLLSEIQLVQLWK